MVLHTDTKQFILFIVLNSNFAQGAAASAKTAHILKEKIAFVKEDGFVRF